MKSRDKFKGRRMSECCAVHTILHVDLEPIPSHIHGFTSLWHPHTTERTHRFLAHSSSGFQNPVMAGRVENSSQLAGA